MLSTVLIVVLILLLVGVLPTWPHSRQWGYYPSGTLGLILVILIRLVLLGRLGRGTRTHSTTTRPARFADAKPSACV
jgi:hypothetical protein